MNRKQAVTRRDGYFAIRVFHRSRKGKRDPRFLFKCGCCDEKLEVYYGGDSLEINGVLGSVENWGELLLPLLMKKPGQKSRPTRRLRAILDAAEKRIEAGAGIPHEDFWLEVEGGKRSKRSRNPQNRQGR